LAAGIHPDPLRELIVLLRPPSWTKGWGLPEKGEGKREQVGNREGNGEGKGIRDREGEWGGGGIV